MRKPLRTHFAALALGLSFALLKLASAFAGPWAFFGIDALIGVTIGAFIILHPAHWGRWATLIGVPPLGTVLFFALLLRTQGAKGVGRWWYTSLLTLPLAIAVASLAGLWISRPRSTSTDQNAGRGSANVVCRGNSSNNA